MYNPNRAIRGEALENTRNATIANGERLRDYIEISQHIMSSMLEVERLSLCQENALINVTSMLDKWLQ
ncbi:hypothetical protein HKD37_04G011168 [Glycine soja]